MDTAAYQETLRLVGATALALFKTLLVIGLVAARNAIFDYLKGQGVAAIFKAELKKTETLDKKAEIAVKSVEQESIAQLKMTGEALPSSTKEALATQKLRSAMPDSVPDDVKRAAILKNVLEMHGAPPTAMIGSERIDLENAE